MARVKRGVTARARHKKMVAQASGYRGRANSAYRIAIEKVEKALRYAYRDRRVKKRDFRGLWIQRINAAAREHGFNYARFMGGLKLDLADPMAHKASTQELLELQQRHPKFSESIHVQRQTIGVRPAALITMHYIGTHLVGEDPAIADAFARVFITGVPGYDGCPAILVRERNIQARLRQQPLAPSLGWSLIVHAWNNFRRRRPMRVVKVPADVRIDNLDIRKL